MKREWFEPGPDGVSPFERLSKTKGFGAAGTAAAFRALLAGEEQSVDTQRSIAAALANGQLSLQDEITRLRAELARLKNECSDQQSYVLDLESAIARKDTRIKVLEVANDSLTQYSSILTAERDALQASLRDEQAKRASIEAELAACRESRDYLRARIDAGVRAWEKWKQQCGSLWLWAFPGATTSQAWSDVCDALDADYVVYPIDQPVDERKGERRKVIPARIRRDGFDYSMDYDTPWMTNRRKYDRRRTPGTIADRGKAS